MRVDLAGERRQAGLVQPQLLGFELLLITRVVPDLQRKHDGEDRAGVEGDGRHHVVFAPDWRQKYLALRKYPGH